MVSPLQIWQHSEPKGLWPVLGGLAVLTHVGLIGMSVPYVLNLTKAGEESAAAAIPIEFVETDTVSEANSRQDSLQETEYTTEQTTAPASTTQTDALAFDAVAAASDRQPAAQLNRADTDSKENTAPVLSAQSGEEAGDSSQKTISESKTHQHSSSQRTQPTAPVNETETAEDELNRTEADEASNSEAEEIAQTDSETAGPAESELEVLEGESLLPLPSTGGESDQSDSGSNSGSNSGSGQSILMNIAAVREDVVQDLPDEFPVLMSSRDLGRRSAEAAGCEPIELPTSAVSLVYRLRVNVDGLVELATLQPGGEGDLLDEAAVSAIACLIEKAGLTFTPAMSDGNPRLDDSTLVTFELIDES